MSKILILNKTGKEVDQIEISPDILDGRINKNILYFSAVNHLRNKRAGLASTKTRKDVSGGGKKPWKQKGTGRARVGSIRSPLWRKGGVVFGPHPRDFSYDLPKDVRLSALKSSLNDKLAGNKICVLDETESLQPKTREFVKVIEALKLGGKILLIVDGKDQQLIRSARNIPGITIRRASDVNAYDILNSGNLLLCKRSLEELFKRLK